MSTATVTEPVQAAPRQTPAGTPSGSPPWAALPVIVAGSLMVILDVFIVNVALPSIALDLSAGSASLEWIVASYAMAEATLLITCGRLGDNLGRRRMYSLGVGLFTVASLACAIAPSAETLIAARLLQGIAGGVMLPQVLAIIGVEFEGAARIKALAVYSMAMGLAAVGAQLVGGALIEIDIAGLGWRSCFLINIPVGLLALALTPRMVPESRASNHSRLDLRGAALVGSGLAAIVLPLIEGRAHGWPIWTWVSFGIAATLLSAFVAYQRSFARRVPGGSDPRDPLLDLTLFRSRPFSAGLATQLVFWCGQASFFAYLALYLQSGRGLDALDAGLVFTIMAVTYVAASGATEKLVERYGRTVPLLGGLALAAGQATLALTVADVGVGGSALVLAPGLLLIGAGMGICLTSLNTIVLATFDDERAGSASGVLATTQALGNSLGVAITGVVFFAAADRGLDRAFELSAAQLVVVGLGVAALTRLLPGGPIRDTPETSLPTLTTKATKEVTTP